DPDRTETSREARARVGRERRLRPEPGVAEEPAAVSVALDEARRPRDEPAVGRDDSGAYRDLDAEVARRAVLGRRRAVLGRVDPRVAARARPEVDHGEHAGRRVDRDAAVRPPRAGRGDAADPGARREALGAPVDAELERGPLGG